MSYCRTWQIKTSKLFISRDREQREKDVSGSHNFFTIRYMCFTYTPSQYSTPGTTPLTHGPLDDIKYLTLPTGLPDLAMSPVLLDTFSESHYAWCCSKSPALLYTKCTLCMVGPLWTQRQGRSSLLPRQPFEKKLAHWHLHPAPSFSRRSQYWIFSLSSC